MKAISIQQPWAWAILHAGKRIENRSWSTRWRGPLLIHAGKAWSSSQEGDRRYLISCFGLDVPQGLPLGGIVGLCDLVDVITASPDRWFEGPFGWVLDNVEPLPFRPYRGALGLFEVTS
jgi:hypothetical protein